MTEPQDLLEKLEPVRSFLFQERVAPANGRFPAVSLFSGGGLSDVGYELAGFEVIVHAEKDANRATFCSKNFPNSKSVIGDLKANWEKVVNEYSERRPDERLALLSVTPPCQGMSSSNPGRGKREEGQGRDTRNRLLLESVPVVRALNPRIVVVENVPQLLTQPNGKVQKKEEKNLIDEFAEQLPNYVLFGRVVQMADYGVPQERRRAILIAVHSNEPWLQRLSSAGVGPWPSTTHAKEPANGLFPWVTLNEWINAMGYSALDANSEESASDSDDPLHFVTVYEGAYYWRVADIPPGSGLSAYDNSNCRSCKKDDVPKGVIHCPACGGVMYNRPHVIEKDGSVRLVKGRHSSYRRMKPDEPARTITTASSHVGSDYKIHPWENRVLSIRECADLQTIPRFYDWSWAFETTHTYLARQIIGEALPPWFTFLQGCLLRRLLNGEEVPIEEFARARWVRESQEEPPEDNGSTA